MILYFLNFTLKKKTRNRTLGKGKLGVPQQTVADKGKRSYIYDRESTLSLIFKKTFWAAIRILE